MNALIVVAMMLSQDPPPDAPVIDMVTERGDIVPFKGYCVEEQEFKKREKVNLKNQIVVEEATKSVLISPPILIGLIVGAVAAGVALTIGGIEIKKAIDKKE